jgi:ATP-binding cassette subfamily F protein 3
MLLIDHVHRRYGERLILNDVTFSVDDAEKVALVGPNGCGKSTLARIIAGEERADAGGVGGSYAGAALRYLPQGAEGAGPLTAAAALPGDVGELWRLGRLLSEGGEASADETLDALTRFDDAGSWSAYEDLLEVLRGLGIGYLAPDTRYAHLSGGERTKLGLAALLYRPGPFLLLDEPTNHLDLDALGWLEEFLDRFAGGLLLISHDRALVDAVADAVVELDPATGTARRFAGGYSDYQEALERERESRLDAYRRQQEQVRRTEEDIRRVKQRAARFDTTSTNDYHRRIGKKVARLAKVRERRLERKLDSEERIEKPKQSWQLKAELTTAERAGDLVLETRGVSLALGGRTLFSDLSLTLRNGERVVITGPNGGGKTSLLRLLLGEIAPDSGSVRLGAGVRWGYLSQQQESVDPRRTPLEEIRAVAPLDESAARTYLHRFLFSGDEVFTRNEALSFGQRSRLALAKLILRGVNLLVLDEPLNHLDIASRERFEAALAGFGGTALAVSHDRYFIRRFAGRLFELAGGALRETDPEAV